MKLRACSTFALTEADDVGHCNRLALHSSVYKRPPGSPLKIFFAQAHVIVVEHHVELSNFASPNNQNNRVKICVPLAGNVEIDESAFRVLHCGSLVQKRERAQDSSTKQQI
jgi:hypothetical protein